MNMIHQKLKKAANIYTVDNILLFHTQNTVATIQCWIVSFPPPPSNARDPVNTKQFKWRHFWNGFGHSRKYALFTSRVSIAAIFYIIELQLWTKSHKTCTSTEAMKCCFSGNGRGWVRWLYTKFSGLQMPMVSFCPFIHVTNTNRIYSGVVFVFGCSLFAQSTCPSYACTAMTERIKSEIVAYINSTRIYFIFVLFFKFNINC